ncbi:MAG: transaldolase family protein [Azospirillaceae bacterium]
MMPDPAGAGAAGLRLYLDSAEPDDWRRIVPTGLVYGVTTDPVLLRRAGQPCTPDHLLRLAELATALGAEEIHLQTWGTTPDAAEATARTLAALDARVVVAVPALPDAAGIVSRLIADGVRVSLGGIHAAGQVLAARALGVAYAAPRLGRLTDAGRDGLGEVAAMREILSAAPGPGPRLLVASVRAVEDAVALARRGIDTMALPPAVAEALLAEPSSARAAAEHQAAAAAMGGEDG